MNAYRPFVWCFCCFSVAGFFLWIFFYFLFFSFSVFIFLFSVLPFFLSHFALRFGSVDIHSIAGIYKRLYYCPTMRTTHNIKCLKQTVAKDQMHSHGKCAERTTTTINLFDKHIILCVENRLVCLLTRIDYSGGFLFSSNSRSSPASIDHMQSLSMKVSVHISVLDTHRHQYNEGARMLRKCILYRRSTANQCNCNSVIIMFDRSTSLFISFQIALQISRKRLLSKWYWMAFYETNLGLRFSRFYYILPTLSYWSTHHRCESWIMDHLPD